MVQRASLLIMFLAMEVMMTVTPVHGQRFDDWQGLGLVSVVLLNTPEKAVDMAETVVRIRFTQAEVDAERPFVAEDKGDTWEVRGTTESTNLLPGQLPASCVVTLRKTTGGIVDFHLATSWRLRPLTSDKDQPP